MSSHRLPQQLLYLRMGASFPPRRPGPLRSSSKLNDLPAPCPCWDLPRSQADPAEAGREGTVPTDIVLRASGCCRPVGDGCVVRPLHFSLSGLPESPALLTNPFPFKYGQPSQIPCQVFLWICSSQTGAFHGMQLGLW